MAARGRPRDAGPGGAGDQRVAREHRLLRLPDPPTAVFAVNDAIAQGIYHAAAQAGMRIPDDLSVVGVDDLPLAEWMVPPLTTVRQPLTEMGAAAARTVLGLGQGIAPAGNRLELATELIVRASTAAPAVRP